LGRREGGRFGREEGFEGGVEGGIRTLDLWRKITYSRVLTVHLNSLLVEKGFAYLIYDFGLRGYGSPDFFWGGGADKITSLSPPGL
jgi:hypothetical protein